MIATALFTWLAVAPAYAKGPPMPDAIAEVTTESTDGTEQITLTLHKTFKHKALGEPARHLDPVSTMLEPRPVAGEGTVYWLVGYGLESHDAPGDTQVTYSLLLEVEPDSTAVQALWWENHMEVPTSLFAGKGSLSPEGGGASLSLSLTHTEYGDDLSIAGAVRGL